MGVRRRLLRNWPIEVYDYDKKSITDEAVGGIDLRRGCWIHCKCNVTLKTTHYSLYSWKNHEMSKTHMDHNQKNEGGKSQPHVTSGESQPQVTSCSSQSISHSSPLSIQNSAKISVEGLQSQEYDSLVFIRRDLYRNKQHQARHERDVSNVINAMTSLITDQQSDIKTLLDKVYEMKNEIQGLKHDLTVIRQREKQRMQAPHKETATTISYTAHRASPSHVLSRNATRFRIFQMTPTYNRVRKTRSRMSDMDIFERRFNLHNAAD
ncbi:hypothetical protein PsorP6_002794 [Peronosclerospora sorghi]|uniref:Uncharacterized protein n=1 Tax=Peronosclerospora sorghi TaxID=230839 RepID=A0ACC0VKW0_9STRA|nr:hypothetical protein PsorP6_002794 [Peronosclerospora sorghi]